MGDNTAITHKPPSPDRVIVVRPGRKSVVGTLVLPEGHHLADGYLVKIRGEGEVWVEDNAVRSLPKAT